MHLLLLGVNQAPGVPVYLGSKIPELDVGDGEPMSLCPAPVFSEPMLPLKATQGGGGPLAESTLCRPGRHRGSGTDAEPGQPDVTGQPRAGGAPAPGGVHQRAAQRR